MPPVGGRCVLFVVEFFSLDLSISEHPKFSAWISLLFPRSGSQRIMSGPSSPKLGLSEPGSLRNVARGICTCRCFPLPGHSEIHLVPRCRQRPDRAERVHVKEWNSRLQLAAEMGFAPTGRLISLSPLPRLWPPTSRMKAQQPWLPQPLGICRKPSKARTVALSTGESGHQGGHTVGWGDVTRAHLGSRICGARLALCHLLKWPSPP